MRDTANQLTTEIESKTTARPSLAALVAKGGGNATHRMISGEEDLSYRKPYFKN